MGQSQLHILDASIAPIGVRLEDALSGCIPGAQPFDIDKVVVDPHSELPHTLPSEKRFEQLVRALGINQKSSIIVYDVYGVYSSPRAWWLFKAFGHEDVLVLDGGLPLWIKRGFEVGNFEDCTSPPGDFSAKVAKERVVSLASVQAGVGSQDTRILDARSRGRFHGQEGEPRPVLRRGHIPSSLNLPHTQVVENGQLLEKGRLEKVFTDLDLLPTHHLQATCGSGITACSLLLAAHQCGHQNLSLFDGSWAEWGAREDVPVATD